MAKNKTKGMNQFQALKKYAELYLTSGDKVILTTADGEQILFRCDDEGKVY